MESIYTSKTPIKKTLITSIIVLVIFSYIFWGTLHFLIIILLWVISLYLISITLTPIFILQKNEFIRFYVLRPFKRKYIYNLKSIEKIEIKDKREGYQAFPSMNIFFTENGKEKKDFFHFIKGTEENFDDLITRMKDNKINVKFLSGN